MPTIAEYCDNNILVIPQALFPLKDAHVLMHSANNAIFYKNLVKDLTQVEFYTKAPCIVYIQSGIETITSADSSTHQLTANTAIFLPQGINLHSDYVKLTQDLKAFLVFFDDNIVTDFLSTLAPNIIKKQTLYKHSIVPLKCNDLIANYFQSLQIFCNQPDLIKQNGCEHLLRIKLLELLNLLTLNENQVLISALLNKPKTTPAKRNLDRLLSSDQILKLSIIDLAALSGRSVSSFNRDFKSLYQQPPKKWLQDRKLNYARRLLVEQGLCVTDTAAMLGYENISHFIKLFKQRFNLTPKQLVNTQSKQ